MKDLSDKIKKNLLDLHYNKNLQYFNTSIIILFTYFISIGVIFITKQIDYTTFNNQLFLIALISILIIGGILQFMLKFRFHMKNIQEEIKKLDLS